MWNFFRLENEHLHNCDNFRATKEIAVPFEYLSAGAVSFGAYQADDENDAI